jgi:hypothetical protein
MIKRHRRNTYFLELIQCTPNLRHQRCSQTYVCVILPYFWTFKNRIKAASQTVWIQFQSICHTISFLHLLNAVEQELPTLSEHLRSPPSLDLSFLCSVLYIIVCPFVLFLYCLRLTASDCPFGILDLWLLIAPLVSLIYGFWLPLWYLRFTAFDCPFGILDLRLLIAPLVS